jgi:hypothetical protein
MCFGAVCAEFMAFLTGHDFENLTTLWHYLNPTLMMLIPGVLVLTGWPSLPYGQVGAGAKPPSLSALSSKGVATSTKLSFLVDKFLNLRAGFSSPQLLEGGSLRPLACAMASTLIMYFEESEVAKEAPTVKDHMITTMMEAMSVTATEALNMLKNWGKMIKVRFCYLPISCFFFIIKMFVVG